MFINFAPNQIQGSQFPVGNYTSDSVGTGSVNGAPASPSNQVGASNPTTGLPSYPNIVQGCTDPLCYALNTGILGPLDQTTIPDQPPPLQTIFNPDNTNFGGNSSPTPINLTQGNPPSGGNPPGNNNNNKNPPPKTGGPPPGPGIGRTLNEQQFSGVPPLNETRFLPGEVVVQISNSVSADRIQQLASSSASQSSARRASMSPAARSTASASAAAKTSAPSSARWRRSRS